MTSDNDQFIENIIEEHNSRRHKHNAADLTHSDELTKLAQTWANKLARQAYISYSEISGVGENITFFPPDIEPDAVVEHWYSEHEKYEYETPGWQTGTNYFTQVVWRATKEIGIGYAIVKKPDEDNISCGSITKSMTSLSSSNGKLAAEGDKIIVAFYRPAGNNNRAGQFAINVQKP
ncbi:unnamed protein product [Caenorhabditis angaria]|uniref:SCP domain-containing protein n=1 Tax=Caenorhabditis angaria TaxID=860376 RepID=A0A9P1J0A6_9PELO|nr:unnamed protein product [Caenorhabditis angaria]